MIRFTLFSLVSLALSWAFGIDAGAALAKSGFGGTIANMFGGGGLSGFLDPFGETEKPKVKDAAMPAPTPQNVPEPSTKTETDAIAEAKAAEAEKARLRRINGSEGTVLTGSSDFGDDEANKKKPSTKKTALGAA